MLLDEATLLEQAAGLSLESATAAKLTADEVYRSELAMRDGLAVETDMALDSLRQWQTRIHATPPDAAATLLKLSLGSPKTSLVAAGELFARHESEQRVVGAVVKSKERGVAVARQALEAGELSLLRARLEAEKSAAFVLAVGHLQVQKLVHETDPTIAVEPGELLVGAVDSITALQLEISRKESKQ